MRLLAGPGQQGEVIPAAQRIEGLDCDFAIADRADDAEHVHDTIRDAPAQPVIPPRLKRRPLNAYDRHLY